MGCPQARPDRPVEAGVAPVAAESTAASRARFAAAVALYEEGRFEASVEAFRLFAAEFPGDPLTVSAERHLGRALAAAGRLGEAEAVYRSLMALSDERDGARLYLGFVSALRGDDARRDSWLDALLDGAPGVRVTDLDVVAGDEALLGALVAEARLRRGDPLGALHDLEGVRRHAPDTLLLEYARDRAVEVAELDLTDDERMAAVASDGVLVRAAALPSAVDVLVARGQTGEAARLVEAVAEAMVEVGLLDALMAAQSRLAAGGDGRDLRYGVLLSLTGPDRRAGRAALGAMLLAQRAFEPEDALSVMLIRDVGGSAEQARAAAGELIAQGAAMLVGPIEPGLAREVGEVARAHGVPVLSLSALPNDAGASGVWRLQVDAVMEARAALQEAVSVRGVRRVVVVRDEGGGAWLEAFAAAAVERVVAAGAEVVLEVTVGGEGDALQQSAERAARRIAATDADAVVLALSPGAATPFLAWMAGVGLWSATDARTTGPRGRRLVTLVGNSFLLGEGVLRNSAEYMTGAILPWWYHPELVDASAAAFAWRFEHTYGRAPGVLEAFAYDAAGIARRMLVAEGRRDGARMIERLGSEEGFVGVTGHVRFDPAGNPQVEPRLATVQAGRLVAR